MVCLFSLISCGDDEDNSSSVSTSDIVKNLMTHKWTGQATDYDIYSNSAAIYKQTWTVYFVTENTGVMHWKAVDNDSSLGTSKNEDDIEFSYTVNGSKIYLSGGCDFIFDYYGDFLMLNDTKFIPSSYSSADYSYLQNYKREGPIDTEVNIINDSEILRSVIDNENGIYTYVLQFGFGASNNDAYQKGMEQIQATIWVDNGCIGEWNSKNVGKKKTYTLYLSTSKKDFFDWIYVDSKSTSIKFNYVLEYYNSKDKNWYDITNHSFTIYANNTGNDSTEIGNKQSPVAIDLGLPSGLIWADRNVGATAPESFGQYFAWGETVGYNGEWHDRINNNTALANDGHSFDWANYKWCKGTDNTLTKYCTNSEKGKVDNYKTLFLSDDAAYVNWNRWRMPTKKEFEELINNTTQSWISINGIFGCKFASKTNENYVFLPAAGHRYEDEIIIGNKSGSYWTSSLFTGTLFPEDAYCVTIYEGKSKLEALPDFRYNGLSIRPVLRN